VVISFASLAPGSLPCGMAFHRTSCDLYLKMKRRWIMPIEPESDGRRGPYVFSGGVGALPALS
jgi:hypothetical protein